MKKKKSKNYNVCKETDLLNFGRRKIFKRRDLFKEKIVTERLVREKSLDCEDF
jgi:hypothetical protein